MQGHLTQILSSNISLNQKTGTSIATQAQDVCTLSTADYICQFYQMLELLAPENQYRIFIFHPAVPYTQSTAWGFSVYSRQQALILITNIIMITEHKLSTIKT